MEFVDEYTPHLEGKEFILNHIKILCNHDEVVYNWFIRWVAQMIQYPEFKSVAPTLISDEGAGKGTLLKLIAKMLGGNRVLETTTPSRDVWGSNNNLLKNAFLVNLNEMSGKETVGADGQIKGLITDPKITINEKYVSSVVIDSFHRFLITTNNEECIRKKKGDRRNIIIRCSDELCVEMPKNVSRRNDLVEYHNKMHGLLEDQNVIKTMYEYFKNEIEDMSDFHKIPVPETEHDREQQEVNRSTIDIFMENFTREHINFTNDNNEPIMRVMISDLFKQFKRYCEKNRMEYDCNVLKFGLRLKRLNVVGVGQMVKTNKGNARILNIEQMKEYYKLGCLIDIDNTDNDSDSD
jgi:putative DNA primase/helicase